MIAVSKFFMGQFTLFTYLRPFLETVTHAHSGVLSVLLLTIVVTGIVGTALMGPLLNNNLLLNADYHPCDHGRHRDRAVGLRQLDGYNGAAARWLGLRGDRRAGSLVDLAGKSAAR